ncbi:hypothetical protein OC835_003456 [Tilletia horrida]|nr:hypothetical protein OC835_003456 [Tilletia horrida]
MRLHLNRLLALTALLGALAAQVHAQGPADGQGSGLPAHPASYGTSTEVQSHPGPTHAAALPSPTAPFPNVTTSHNTTLMATATAATSLPSSIPSAAASATSDPSSADSLPLDTKVDGAFAVLGVVLILSGAATCGWGHRNRWSSFFVCGFYVLAISTLCAILSLGVEKGVNPPSTTVRGLFLLACLIAGIVGGILFILFYTWAAFAVCGLGGFAFALWLQALKSNGLIEPLGVRWILLAGMTSLFFAAACIPRMHNPMVLVSTAMSGATALLLGIDCFSRAGLKEFYIRNLGYQGLFADKYPPTFQNNHFPLVASMQVELGVMAAVAAMGMAFQSRLFLIARDRIEHIRDADRDRKLERAANKAARHISRTAERDLAEWESHFGGHGPRSGSQGERTTHDSQEIKEIRQSSPPQLAMPRLWLSHTPMRSPAGSDADLEKAAAIAQTTPRLSTRKSAQGSFMAYVNGQSSPPHRGGIGRKGAEQSPGLLPSVNTGTALGLSFSTGSAPSPAPQPTEMRKSVAEERNTIMKEIAKIRASISELECGSIDASPAAPPVPLLPVPPVPAEIRQPTSSKASSMALPSSEHLGMQHRTVSAATFAWVQDVQPAAAFPQAHSAHSHSTHATADDSARRRQSTGEYDRIITGSARSRRASQMTTASSGRHTPQPPLQSQCQPTAHTKSMSIDELQSRHRDRMRSRQRSVNDLLAVQKARAEWDQRQADERARMAERVRQHSSQGHGRPQRNSLEAGKALDMPTSHGVGCSSSKNLGRVRARSIDWQQLGAPDLKRSRPSGHSSPSLAAGHSQQPTAAPAGQPQAQGRARKSMGF